MGKMGMVRIVREGHTIQTVPATATREVMEDQTTGTITANKVPGITTVHDRITTTTIHPVLTMNIRTMGG
jgi:hypothetical protein